MMKKLSKLVKLYVILGNHDIHLKNSKDIHSLRILQNVKNIEIIENPTEIIINDKRVLLCPWLSDLSSYKEETFDYMIGHFDISSKYLISSYIEDQKIKSIESTDQLTSMLVKSNAISINQLQDLETKEMNQFINKKSTPKSSKYIGRFIDLCKVGGTIFSGHIHTQKRFMTRKREFIFVGSPFEQNWGDKNKSYGFYDLDMLEDNHTFIECNSSPKHLEVKLSDAIIDDYDFNKLQSNFVKLLIDTKIEYNEMNNIINKIGDLSIEPCILEYQIFIGFDDMVVESDVSFDDVSFDKSHYILSYIDKIDNTILEEHKLDRHKLKQLALNYFKQAVDNLKID
jgi:hypothetical protein